MQPREVQRAVGAARSVASSLGLTADRAVVLQNSNKVTLHLLPCDVVARVAPVEDQVLAFEVELAQQLTGRGCPVAALEPRVTPRVHRRDGFAMTLWVYYEPVVARPPSSADYAAALLRLHAGLSEMVIAAPHVTDRVASARELLARRDRTPALHEDDRRLLDDTLRDLGRSAVERGAPEQLLHGEPHPGNLLTTSTGPRFVDLETCCRGPVEFDLAHAPDDVSAHYPGVDQGLLLDCRILVLAMTTTWRWDRDDQLPDGHRLAAAWIGELRAGLRRRER